MRRSVILMKAKTINKYLQNGLHQAYEDQNSDKYRQNGLHQEVN